MYIGVHGNGKDEQFKASSRVLFMIAEINSLDVVLEGYLCFFTMIKLVFSL
jgi:hypothetical protein